MSSTAQAGDLFDWTKSPPLVPDDPPGYPNSPGFKGERGGPSEQAANAIAPKVTGLRRTVLDFLKQQPDAMTADAIAAGVGRSILSIRPRVAELNAMGLIQPDAQRGTNESGMTAHRWRVASNNQEQQK